MDIHIVQPDETIYSIASKYNVSADRIIIDNGLTTNDLVLGQSLVILYPLQTYSVKAGDTLESIADAFQVPVIQLYQNNNFLANHPTVYPGENLVIRYYNDAQRITVFGYCFPFIDAGTLTRTLPYLTYLCVAGSEITLQAQISSIDDEEIISKANAAGVAPLLLLSSLIQQDINYIEDTYFILTDEIMSNTLIRNIVSHLVEKGYQGLCVMFEYLNPFNAPIFVNFIRKLSAQMKAFNLKIFVTISPKNSNIDLHTLNNSENGMQEYTDGMIIMDYNRNAGADTEPMPVTSIHSLETFLQDALTVMPKELLSIGCPVIGIDWELPYVPNISQISIVKYYTALEIAAFNNSVITLDEDSQTPFFVYAQANKNGVNRHIVWFVDASTLSALTNLIIKYQIDGTGLWNAMYFLAPLWSIINSQFEINKIPFLP